MGQHVKDPDRLISPWGERTPYGPGERCPGLAGEGPARTTREGSAVPQIAV